MGRNTVAKKAEPSNRKSKIENRESALPAIAISSTSVAVKIPAATLRKLIRCVAKAESCRLAQVDLAIVSAEEIALYNRRFLRHLGETDVLSFDLTESELKAKPQAAMAVPGLSIQLIVCGDVAAKQGPLRGLTAEHELMLYIVHGLLHQMGYEDLTVRGRAKMHAREDEILSDFGPGPAFYASKPKTTAKTTVNCRERRGRKEKTKA